MSRIGHVFAARREPSTELALAPRFRYLRRMRGPPRAPRSRARMVASRRRVRAAAHKAKTPGEAYKRFSAAVNAGDGGALFDALDQETRWNWMTIQKFHREAYDIVLSNYPEGRDPRARDAPLRARRDGPVGARAVRVGCARRRCCRCSRRWCWRSAPIEAGPTARTWRRRCWRRAHGCRSARQERRLGLRRPRQARGGRQEPRVPRPGGGARQRRRLRARRRARREMSRKPAERRRTGAALAAAAAMSRSGGGGCTARAARTAAAPRRAPARPRAASRRPSTASRGRISVSELLKAARLTLESRFADVRVEGEVSGLKRSGNGHLYFSLKDDEASLDCVMFSREAARLKFTLEDGMAVRCRGRLTIYEARGKFQMTVDDDRADRARARWRWPSSSSSSSSAPRACSSRRASGRCPSCRAASASSRRRRAPSSATSSASRTAAARRRSCWPPTPVQGDGAASASRRHPRARGVADVDLIIVARGGGSLEDLWAFNEEPVARAIAACRVPVISAVGHETDFTIADFVADLRAPTPSAAAELAVPVRGTARRAGAAAPPRRARDGRGARRAPSRLERARTRLGDPRRLLDQRRQRLTNTPSAAGGCWRAGSRGARRPARRRERLHRAHPQRRIAEQRHALAAMRPGWRPRCSRALVRRRRAIEAAAASWRRSRRCACSNAGSASPSAPTGRRYQRRRRAAGRAGHRARARRRHRRDRRGDARKSMIRAAVLGADVSKSRSPAIHHAAYAALGIEGEYGAITVDGRGSRAGRRARRARLPLPQRFTIPHKAAAFAIADRPTRRRASRAR